MMCGCTCHTEGFAGCADCAHLHTAAEQVDEPQAPSVPTPVRITVDGTRDGVGSADHDHPYQFGRTPTVTWPFPFSAAVMGRLLTFKSRLGDARRELKNRGRDEEAAA